MPRITNGRDPLQSEIREAVRADAGCQSHVSMRLSSCVSAIAALPLIASIVTPNADALAQTCAVSMWTVDNYEVVDSDCGDVVKESVRSALEGLGPDFTVRQSSDHVEIDGSHGIAFQDTIDPDETAHVQRRLNGSAVTCDHEVDVDASTHLSTSSSMAAYSGAVDFSSFCLEFSDRSVQITARWTRVDG